MWHHWSNFSFVTFTFSSAVTAFATISSPQFLIKLERKYVTTNKIRPATTDIIVLSFSFKRANLIPNG